MVKYLEQLTESSLVHYSTPALPRLWSRIPTVLLPLCDGRYSGRSYSPERAITHRTLFTMSKSRFTYDEVVERCYAADLAPPELCSNSQRLIQNTLNESFGTPAMRISQYRRFLAALQDESHTVSLSDLPVYCGLAQAYTSDTNDGQPALCQAVIITR